MKAGDRISLRHISEIYRIDFALVLEWGEFGLYPMGVEPDPSVDLPTMETLKRIISLHRALGVNKEGIEVILGLTQKIAGLEQELRSVRTKLEWQSRGWGTERPASLEIEPLG